MWQEHNGDLATFICACVDACLCFEGDPPRRGRQAGLADAGIGADGQPEVGEVAAVQSTWNASMAKTIMAVKKQLSVELGD